MGYNITVFKNQGIRTCVYQVVIEKPAHNNLQQHYTNTILN